jgi:lambda repressor-like predicted transcriptional regulator
MTQRHAWGLLAAAALGLVSGYCLAPKPARRELSRRAARNISTLQNIAAREGSKAARAVSAAAGVASRAAGKVVRRITGPLSVTLDPTQKLKDAIAADPILAQRPIWIDAVGDTMLLHGVVEDDEEWHSADLLARLASPDGSVRNLLQVRRQPAT